MKKVKDCGANKKMMVRNDGLAMGWTRLRRNTNASLKSVDLNL